MITNTTPKSKAAVSWLEDKQIIAFTVRDVSRSTVDLWALQISQTFREWPLGKTYLALYDFSDPAISLTPYTRIKANDLYGIRHKMRGRVAVVLPRTFAADATRLFLRAISGSGLIVQTFFTREHALMWLRQLLPSNLQSNPPSVVASAQKPS